MTRRRGYIKKTDELMKKLSDYQNELSQVTSEYVEHSQKVDRLTDVRFNYLISLGEMLTFQVAQNTESIRRLWNEIEKLDSSTESNV